MIHILVIGPNSTPLTKAFDPHDGSPFKVTRKSLPTAGLRAFKSVVPDVVIVHSDTISHALKLVHLMVGDPTGEFTQFFIAIEDPETDLPDELPQNTEVLALSLPDEEIRMQVLREVGLEERETDEFQRIDSVGENEESLPEDFAEKASAQLQNTISKEDEFPEKVEHQLSLDRIEENVTDSEIDSKLETVRHENYFDILELPLDGNDTDARQLYEILSKRYDPDRVDPRIRDQYKDELEEILDALQDAWAVLGESELRDLYARKNGLK